MVWRNALKKTIDLMFKVDVLLLIGKKGKYW
jgi:hypothetical protein